MQESSDSAPLLTEHDYIGLSEVSSSVTQIHHSGGHDQKDADFSSSSLGIGLDLGLGLGLGLGTGHRLSVSKEEAVSKRCEGEGPVKSQNGSSGFPEFLSLPSLQKNGSKRGYAEANICGALKKNEACFHHHNPNAHVNHLDSSSASYVPVVEASSSTPEQHLKTLVSPSFLQTWPPPSSSSSSSMNKNGSSSSNVTNVATAMNPWQTEKPVSTNAFNASEKAPDTTSGDEAPPPCKDRVVGWPPVRSYRRQTLAKPAESFVKVNMDGITVGRKVDLNAYTSYEGLLGALEEMFRPSSNAQGASQAPSGRENHFLLSGGSDFVLTYEDKDGDWMLVGDVPWSMFISTVKRLRITRGSEANTPASRGAEKSRL